MPSTTITEALSDLRTVVKRLETKREYVERYLTRPAALVDPLQREGGSVALLERELQAIHDLEERTVALRRAIAQANATTTIKVGAVQRTVADWLVWRREVAPKHQEFLLGLAKGIERARQQAQTPFAQEARRGWPQTQASAPPPGSNADVVVNISEARLHEWTERLAETLGALDGQLSLRNATTLIEVD